MKTGSVMAENVVFSIEQPMRSARGSEISKLNLADDETA
jgi:hypothetical protein